MELLGGRTFESEKMDKCISMWWNAIPDIASNKALSSPPLPILIFLRLFQD